MKFGGFDWDAGNRAKCQKHGVSIEEIEQVMLGDPRIAPDIKHSDFENRYIAIGRTTARRPLFVAFIYRTKGDETLVRPVSARYMHKKEVEGYEKESP